MRTRFSLEIGFLCTILACCASASGADDGSACQRAQAWVQTLGDNIPTTAHAFVPLTPTQRTYAFDALSPDAKSQLWRERLEVVLAERELTPSQHALVREAISLFSADLYREQRTPSQDWRDRVATAFSRSEAVEIFETLGPTSSQEPSCNCNDNNDCGGMTTCVSQPCNPTKNGCGPGGSSSCGDGRCQ